MFEIRKNNHKTKIKPYLLAVPNSGRQVRDAQPHLKSWIEQGRLLRDTEATRGILPRN